MSETEGLTLRLSRVLHAPKSIVFNMQTDRGGLARWWGPKGFTLPRADIDLRVGGRYRFTMQPPKGDPFHLIGEYLEVDPPNRLSYTFRWEEPTPDDRETRVFLSLRDVGDSTELIVEQGSFATEERRSLHEQGWTESLDRLAQLLRDTVTPSGER